MELINDLIETSHNIDIRLTHSLNTFKTFNWKQYVTTNLYKFVIYTKVQYI